MFLYAIIAGLVALGIGGGHLLLRGKKTNALLNYLDRYPQDVQDRLVAAGLPGPVRNKFKILDPKRLQRPQYQAYILELPGTEATDGRRSWVLRVRGPRGTELKRKEVESLFDADWRTAFPGHWTGLDAETKQWKPVFEPGSPARYSKLNLAIDLLEVYPNATSGFPPRRLLRWEAALKDKLMAFDPRLQISPEPSLPEALATARELIELRQLTREPITLVLKNERGIPLADAWEALWSTGLYWGANHQFHWNNENLSVGADHHFSVYTRTSPEYFVPEEVASGNKAVADLVFSFYLPHCADPVGVYGAMLECAKYCRKQLGGTFETLDGGPFSKVKTWDRTAKVVDRMKQAGYPPGEKDTREVF